MSEYGIEYAGIVACFIIAGAIAGGMVFFSSILGKKTPSAVKSAPFECGETPFSLPGGKMAIKFYLTAILFILFDVEVIFLYPWAVIYRSLGMVGLVEPKIILYVLRDCFAYSHCRRVSRMGRGVGRGVAEYLRMLGGEGLTTAANVIILCIGVCVSDDSGEGFAGVSL